MSDALAAPVKFCRDCKWISYEETIEPRSYLQHTCAHKYNHITQSIVTGNNIYRSTCATARADHSLCAHEGRWWESKRLVTTLQLSTPSIRKPSTKGLGLEDI